MRILALPAFSVIIPLVAVVFFLLTFALLMMNAGILDEEPNHTDRTSYQRYRERLLRGIRNGLLALIMVWIVLIALTYALTSLIPAIITAVCCPLLIILMMIVA